MAEQDLTGNAYELPECWADPVEISGNPVRQLLVPSVTVAIEDEAGAAWAVTRQAKWRVIRNGDDPGTELAVLSSLAVCRRTATCRNTPRSDHVAPTLSI